MYLQTIDKHRSSRKEAMGKGAKARAQIKREAESNVRHGR